MKRRIWWCALAVALVAGVAGVSAASSEWASAVERELWEQCDGPRRADDELDRLTHAAISRINAKADVIDELHDGGLTLREAVRRFRDLNSGNPKFVEQSRLSCPDRTEDECQLGNVIDCARTAADRYPDGDTFVARLMDEMRSDLKRSGVRLCD